MQEPTHNLPININSMWLNIKQNLEIDYQSNVRMNRFIYMYLTYDNI